MNTKNDIRRAKKGTLMITPGCYTKSLITNFVNNSKAIFGDLSEALLRMKNRKPSSGHEEWLIVLSVAKASGDIERDRENLRGYKFRGFRFHEINALSAETAKGLRSRFTAEEWNLMKRGKR